jgi:hypothetical protein
MENLKTKLQGKKTYILAVLGIIAVWADYFFGLGLSDSCANTVEVCTLSLESAVKATFAIGMATTLRAGIEKK